MLKYEFQTDAMGGKRVLIVEDDKDLAEMIGDVLRKKDFEVSIENSGSSAFESLKKGRTPEVILTDFRLPGMGGMELMEEVRRISPDVPVIMITAHGTTDIAIEATQKGAFDYLPKPFKSVELISIIERALQTSKTTGRKLVLGDSKDLGRKNVLIGNSRSMQKVYREIGRLADKNITVLIQGETGTGKELVAQAIHHHSGRIDKPFIAVNCTAIPDNLLESELFGHEKGAFTGARQLRIGRFEQAESGTLFLDEIGDMTPETQVKMLRVLQEKTIRRVGGNEEIPVDVRVIAATHQNLEQAVADGRFREDLYYRINAAIIDLPPLRERSGDIELLIKHFIALHCEEYGTAPPRICKEGIKLLSEHPWPGNVRELENTTRKIFIRANGFSLSPEDIREWLSRSSSTKKEDQQVDDFDAALAGKVGRTLLKTQAGELENPHAYLVEELEREMVAQALRMTGGNQSASAKLLGLSRITFREKMDRFGLLTKKKKKKAE